MRMRAGLKQYTVMYNKVLAINNHWDIFFTSFYQQKQTKTLFCFPNVLQFYISPHRADLLQCYWFAFKIVRNALKCELL